MNRPCVQSFKHHSYIDGACKRRAALRFCPVCQRALRLHVNAMTCAEINRAQTARVVKFARGLQQEIEASRPHD